MAPKSAAVCEGNEKGKWRDLLFFDVESSTDNIILIGDGHRENARLTGTERSTDRVDGQTRSADDCVGRSHHRHQHELVTGIWYTGTPAVGFNTAGHWTLYHWWVTDASHLVTCIIHTSRPTQPFILPGSITTLRNLTNAVKDRLHGKNESWRSSQMSSRRIYRWFV